MKKNRPLIRRTFLQDRFDILIKKQRNGQASFNDLTELDDIVNRDPAIRESILKRMQSTETTTGEDDLTQQFFDEPIKHIGLIEQIRAFINRLFFSITIICSLLLAKLTAATWKRCAGIATLNT